MPDRRRPARANRSPRLLACGACGTLPAVGAAPPPRPCGLFYRAAMDVIEDAGPANQHPTERSGTTVVVLREPDSGEGVLEAARWLGADPDLADNLRHARIAVPLRTSKATG